MAINRIDSTPARISTNFTVSKQSQGTNFGERVHTGLQQGAAAVANGAALVGGALPGGAIISAAVSSVTSLAGQGGASSAAYAATGAVGGTVGGGGINTTVGAGGNPVTTGGSVGSPNLTGGASSNNVGTMNNELAAASSENAKLLQVQISMQRENQVFTSVSNVLKTKHDTVKNSISNIR